MQSSLFLRFSSVIVMMTMVLFIAPLTHAATLVERLSGRILLQVESKGEAWYVEPKTGERWYMGRPADAFQLMRRFGLGITNVNLAKIPRAGSSDKGDAKFTKRFLGRILLDVQSHGEAWYVYPKDARRYFLGRPSDAFALMRQLGLGVANANLNAIAIAQGSLQVPVAPVHPAPVVGGGSAPSVFAPEPEPSSPVVVSPSPTSPSPTPTPEPSPSPAPSPTPAPSDGSFSDVALRFLLLVNQERTSIGLSALALNQQLTVAAEAHVDDMRARSFFATENPDGESGAVLAKKAGYESRQSAMLIAEGPVTADDLFDLWKNGDGRALLLNSKFEDLGIGSGPSNTTTRPRNRFAVLLASSQLKYEAAIKVSLADIDAMRSSQLARLNAERAQQNLPPLILNELLHQSAQKHADDMLARDFFEHVNPDGVTPHQRITATGYQARISAENLAVGPTTVDQVMTGWMNSPGHRANILLDGIEEVGFGLSIGRNATGFKVYWVQNFGRR